MAVLSASLLADWCELYSIRSQIVRPLRIQSVIGTLESWVSDSSITLLYLFCAPWFWNIVQQPIHQSVWTHHSCKHTYTTFVLQIIVYRKYLSHRYNKNVGWSFLPTWFLSIRISVLQSHSYSHKRVVLGIDAQISNEEGDLSWHLSLLYSCIHNQGFWKITILEVKQRWRGGGRSGLRSWSPNSGKTGSNPTPGVQEI